MKNKKTILIVGLGAIGSVLYRRLNLKKYKVVCLTSVKSSKLIRKKGLRVKLTTDVSPKLLNCEIYNVLPEDRIFNKCIVTTKSWMNELIVEDLQRNLSSTASILLFQNGLDIENPFLKTNEKWKISRALTSLAAYREKKNETFEANVGHTILGAVNFKEKETINNWKDILTQIGLSVDIAKEIQKEIWLKTTVNCTIGPLAAITQLTNGEVLKDTFLNRIIRTVILEMLSIIPEEISITFDESIQIIERIVEETYNHKASMLQDIEGGKRTEIDVLNGQIVEIAKEKGIKVPANEKINELVKQISEGNVPKEQVILDLRSL